MFSLIIIIISILLVGALALATVYYGHTSLLSGSESAVMSRVLNEGSQVEAAIRLFRVEQHRVPDSIGDLVEKSYLAALPPGRHELEASKFHFGDGYVFSTVSESTMCEAINARLGIVNAIPQCDDPAIASMKVCCEAND